MQLRALQQCGVLTGAELKRPWISLQSPVEVPLVCLVTRETAAKRWIIKFVCLHATHIDWYKTAIFIICKTLDSVIK